jgi:hypothetical protein
MPTMSLVTEGNQLVSALGQGNPAQTEYPVSMEMIYPDHERAGIQVEAGLKQYLSPGAAQPAFRLYFRGKYGATRLETALFPDSAVETFDTLLLQPVDSLQASAVSNQWLRDSQLAMSGPAAHGTFVHLYLDGTYQGLYNLLERPDADFITSYVGGEKEEWFVADRSGSLTDNLGSQADALNYLFTLLALAERLDGEPAGVTPPADAYAGAAFYLDPTQLSDYVILSWYAQALGWPESNWYAAIRLGDRPGQGRLIVGEPAAVTRNPAAANDGPENDTIHRLFATSMQDADFRIKFADRMYKHLFNDGALTDTVARDRWLRLDQIVEGAITRDELASNTAEEWLQTDESILSRMDGQAANLIQRARDAGYYPEIDPPVLSRDGGFVEAGFVLRLSLPDDACQTCRIYYTTDGSDPRMPVTGEINPLATAYDLPVSLSETTTHLKARVWKGPTSGAEAPAWSALREVTFSVVPQDAKLRITEVMYNPVDGDDYEFLELTNVGNHEVELANIFIDEGVSFTFPPGSPPLAPGEALVLVSNPAVFAERHPGVRIGGAYDGHLSNKGEKITLLDAAGQTLVEFEYNDEYGWPISADGRGDSLNLINPAGDPNDPRNWRASLYPDGSPGVVDEAIVAISR